MADEDMKGGGKVTDDLLRYFLGVPSSNAVRGVELGDMVSRWEQMLQELDAAFFDGTDAPMGFRIRAMLADLQRIRQVAEDERA